MTTNHVMTQTAKASAAYPLAGQFSPNQAFYDQVRSNFLHQSAKYLRTSLPRRRTISRA